MGKRKRGALGEGFEGLLGRAQETAPGDEESMSGSAHPAAEAASPREQESPDPLWQAAAGADAPEPAPAAPEPTAQECSLVVEDMDLLHSFVQECEDHLHTIQDKIISLEESRNLDVVNEIFRCMHTMKGNASFLGSPRSRRSATSSRACSTGCAATW